MATSGDVALVVLLYVIEGAVLSALGNTIPALCDEIHSIRAAALLAVCMVPFSLKAVFAPFVDATAPPLLPSALCHGDRRGQWVVASCTVAAAAAVWAASRADDALAPGSPPAAVGALRPPLLLLAAAAGALDTCADAWGAERLRCPQTGSVAQSAGLELGGAVGGLLFFAARPASTPSGLMGAVAALALAGAAGAAVAPTRSQQQQQQQRSLRAAAGEAVQALRRALSLLRQTGWWCAVLICWGLCDQHALHALRPALAAGGALPSAVWAALDSASLPVLLCLAAGRRLLCRRRHGDAPRPVRRAASDVVQPHLQPAGRAPAGAQATARERSQGSVLRAVAAQRVTAAGGGVLAALWAAAGPGGAGALWAPAVLGFMVARKAAFISVFAANVAMVTEHGTAQCGGATVSATGVALLGSVWSQGACGGPGRSRP
eukprot:TRINITY_DN21227_c0_g1_i1.p1 TRINITY_DN21227_c0_g1~~TRINITY_DN21227_c0_g1_i1.p1  ORF type:complete len:434 (+),score=77.81 TRINITY_DN21227_c0_g1_i1:71-1372(+)